MLAVVSDSSPFVYLAALGRFGLLRSIYGRVLIPKAVWDEVGVQGGTRPESILLRQAVAESWVSLEHVADPFPAILENLDEGEREAILLAKRSDALLIIDEARGRAAAEQIGVRCTGTLGVLVEAKLRGLIPCLRPELERLRSETNFRFTEAVFHAALERAGESMN